MLVSHEMVTHIGDFWMPACAGMTGGLGWSWFRGWDDGGLCWMGPVGDRCVVQGLGWREEGLRAGFSTKFTLDLVQGWEW